MKHWVDHIWSTEYVTYEALNILHMKHWVDHIWNTEYTTYEALNISHIKHSIHHIWSIEYTTYEALKEQWNWFYKSVSYFALLEDLSLILMRLSTNSKK